MTFDTLKSGTTQPTEDLDHLITLMAFQARSTRSEHGLTQEQQQEIYNRFSPSPGSQHESCGLSSRMIASGNSPQTHRSNTYTV
jgi:hypothetical protein